MISDRIIYLDDCLACVNKLPTELVEWNDSGDTPLSGLLQNHLAELEQDDFVGIVHRLDRPTSGAVLFARNQECLRTLNHFLREQKIQKTYWAVVDAPPPESEGTLEHYVLHKRELNKSYALSDPRPGAKPAALSYRLRAESDRYYLLEIDLHTGRHHQIRAQLYRLGCHIKGDLKYGFPRSNKAGGIHLHARTLVLPHPRTGDRLVLTAPVPEDPLWRFFSAAIDS